MTTRPQRVRAALPTLFTWHALRAVVAVAMASPALAVVGDSRWYASAIGPPRIELGLLAQGVLGATGALSALGPQLASVLVAYVVVTPIATLACHRAMLRPGRVGARGYLAFAWGHWRTAYAIAMLSAAAQLIWCAGCGALAWTLRDAAPPLSAPLLDGTLVATVAVAMVGCLVVRTLHDVVVARIATGTVRLSTALRASACTRLGTWTTLHAGSWLAIAAVWALAAATGFALLGDPLAGTLATVGAHQTVALAAAWLRWSWLATAAEIASTTDAYAAQPAPI